MKFQAIVRAATLAVALLTATSSVVPQVHAHDKPTDKPSDQPNDTSKTTSTLGGGMFAQNYSPGGLSVAPELPPNPSVVTPSSNTAGSPISADPSAPATTPLSPAGNPQQVPTIPTTETPPTANPGKITVIPIGKNVVTMGFQDGGSSITDGTIVTATVSLNVAHRANPPPSVEITMPGLLCGRTQFVFDAKDPASFEQPVTCRTDAGSSTSGSMLSVKDLTITYRFPGAQPPQKQQQQTVKRTVIPAARCSIHGDPHVSTLDSRAFDFMEQGVFRMFASRSLQVQVFLENCDRNTKTKSVTCARGVAIALGSSVARLFVDDKKIVVAKGTASAADWLAIERLGGKTDAYRVFLNADHAAFVDVTLAPFGNKDPYLNVVLQASALVRASDAEGGVSGICGDWNGKGGDDQAKTDELVALHAISTSDNLLTCLNDACVKFTKTATPHDEMAKTLMRGSDAVAKLHQGYTPLTSDALALRVFDTTRVAASAAVVERQRQRSLRRQSTPVDTEVARRMCQQVLIDAIPTCAKYLSEGTQRQYVDNVCAADVVLQGDLNFVDSAKLSYLRECRREIDTRLTGVATADTMTSGTKKLVEDREAMHFGDLVQCEQSCYGRGECLAAGCKCAQGFTGLACKISISA